MRKLFRTRVPIACAALTALLGLPAAPANAATLFAGTCVTTARLNGNMLELDANNLCVYVPHLVSSLHSEGFIAPVLPLGVCSTGVWLGLNYPVTAWQVTRPGQLNVINSGTLQLAFISNDKQMAFAGELAPAPGSGTCPNVWTGVLVIEDPEL